MAESDTTSHKLLINIGFNKGYNFAIWSNLFAPWTKITAFKWFNAIDKTELYKDWRESCGKCKDCFAKINESKWKHSQLDTYIQMIGIDMNVKNVELVNKVKSNLLNMPEINFNSINFTTLLAGGSNNVSEIYLPVCNLGDEACSLSDAGSGYTSSSSNSTTTTTSTLNVPNTTDSIVRVPLVTVEKLVSDIDSDLGLQSGGHVVDILLIDTEGHDPLVLEG